MWQVCVKVVGSCTVCMILSDLWCRVRVIWCSVVCGVGGGGQVCIMVHVNEGMCCEVCMYLFIFICLSANIFLGFVYFFL